MHIKASDLRDGLTIEADEKLSQLKIQIVGTLVIGQLFIDGENMPCVVLGNEKYPDYWLTSAPIFAPADVQTGTLPS